MYNNEENRTKNHRHIIIALSFNSMGNKNFLTTEAFISFPGKLLAITKDSTGFLSFGMKNDPKTHIMWYLSILVTKTPGKWISLYILPRNKPFMSFPGKFSTSINVSMSFSVFWVENGSKHVLCHIYPSQQQNT